MNEEDRNLIVQLTLGRIEKHEFLRRYSAKFDSALCHIHALLLESQRNQDGDELECAIMLGAMLLGSNYSIAPKSIPVLCQLLAAQWHQQHENIVEVLDDFRDPNTIDFLFQAAQMRFDYLAYNESAALAIKCMWALKKIGTDDALRKIRLLKQSETRQMVRQALGDILAE